MHAPSLEISPASLLVNSLHTCWQGTCRRECRLSSSSSPHVRSAASGSSSIVVLLCSCLLSYARSCCAFHSCPLLSIDVTQSGAAHTFTKWVQWLTAGQAVWSDGHNLYACFPCMATAVIIVAAAHCAAAERVASLLTLRGTIVILRLVFTPAHSLTLNH